MRSREWRGPSSRSTATAALRMVGVLSGGELVDSVMMELVDFVWVAQAPFADGANAKRHPAWQYAEPQLW